MSVPSLKSLMYIAVIRAAILMSAARVEMWFLGDLLGILSIGALSKFVVSCRCSLSCEGWLVSLEAVFGELMGFSSLLPLMYVLPSGAITT